MRSGPRTMGCPGFGCKKLAHRFQAEGETAFTPRSRKLHGNLRAVSVDVEDRIVRLRKELSKRVPMPGRRRSRRTCRSPGLIRCRRSARYGGSSAAGVRQPATAEAAALVMEEVCAEQPNERWWPTSPIGGWPTAPRWRS
jgi:hypothetical protein